MHEGISTSEIKTRILDELREKNPEWRRTGQYGSLPQISEEARKRITESIDRNAMILHSCSSGAGVRHLLLEKLRKIRSHFSFVSGNYVVLVATWASTAFVSAWSYPYLSLYVLRLGGSYMAVSVMGYLSWLIISLVCVKKGHRSQ